MGRRRPATPPPSGPDGTLHAAIPLDRLDLHGESAADARRKLGWFIERWERQRPGAVLEVVTGRGTRSTGDPVLKPLVEQALRGEFAERVARWVVHAGGGAFLVELTERR